LHESGLASAETTALPVELRRWQSHGKGL